MYNGGGAFVEVAENSWCSVMAQKYIIGEHPREKRDRPEARRICISLRRVCRESAMRADQYRGTFLSLVAMRVAAACVASVRAVAK